MKTIYRWIPISETLKQKLQLSNDNQPPITNFKIYQKIKTQHLKNAGNIGSLCQGTRITQDLDLEYLAVMLSDETRELGQEDSGIIQLGFGIGVTLHVRNIKSKIRFNFASIAASAELGLLDAQYTIVGYGVDHSIFEIFDISELSGKFDYNTHHKIIKLVNNLKKHISKNKNIKLAPVEQSIEMTIDKKYSPLYVRKYLFATEYLVKGNSLQELIAKCRREQKNYMDEDICNFVYSYFNVENVHTSPSDTSKEIASQWLEGKYTQPTTATATKQWIPIDTDLHKDGHFRALSSLENGLELKPHDKAQLNNDGNGENLKLVFSSFSRSFSSDLKIAIIGGFEGQYNDKTIFIDAVHYKEITTKEPIGGIIYGTRYGIGVRLKLNLTNIELGVDINQLSIGAIMELGLANVEYEITGIGINDTNLFELFPGPLGLNNNPYHTILESLDAIKQRIGNLKKADLNYQPFMIYVKDVDKIDPLTYQRDYIFGQKCISEGLSLNQTLMRAKELGLTDKIVKTITEIYETENIPKDNRPLKATRDRAKSWLTV